MSTKPEKDWMPTAKMKPREGDVVRAMDSGGHVQRLIFERNLWWFEDKSMYVYFTPLFWQPL